MGEFDHQKRGARSRRPPLGHALVLPGLFSLAACAEVQVAGETQGWGGESFLDTAGGGSIGGSSTGAALLGQGSSGASEESSSEGSSVGGTSAGGTGSGLDSGGGSASGGSASGGSASGGSASGGSFDCTDLPVFISGPSTGVDTLGAQIQRDGLVYDCLIANWCDLSGNPSGEPEWAPGTGNDWQTVWSLAGTCG